MQGQHHTWAHLQVLNLITVCAGGPRVPDGAIHIYGRTPGGVRTCRLATRDQLLRLAYASDGLIFRPVDSSCWIVCTADQSQ